MHDGDDREDLSSVKLDDLLDEILQKNMEAVVRIRDDGVTPTAEWTPEAEVFTDLKVDETEDLALLIEREVAEEVNDAYIEDRIEEDIKVETATDDNERLQNALKSNEEFTVIEMEVGTEEDKRITAKDIRKFVLYIAAVMLLTFVLVNFVAQRTRVSGSSMESTLSDGDNLIVDKITYRFNEPKRFDVIIFPYRHTDDTYYIKRIIGLPGETVQIDNDGGIWINGVRIEDPYEREKMLDPGIAIEPVTLENDEYFVLGDNRNNSQDSRFAGVGLIDRDDIIGKAWIRVFPFKDIGIVE